jgi:DNA-binding MarR family transcriptional regulator
MERASRRLIGIGPAEAFVACVPGVKSLPIGGDRHAAAECTSAAATGIGNIRERGSGMADRRSGDMKNTARVATAGRSAADGQKAEGSSAKAPRKASSTPTGPATRSPLAKAKSLSLGTALHAELKSLNDSYGCERSGDAIRANSDTLIRQWKSEKCELDLSAFEISLRVRRIGMLLDEVLSQACESLGVKPNEMLLLFTLRRIGPPYCMRPTDIQNLTAVTSGTVTYRIDQLVKQNLAERIADPVDRRGYLIRLTEHGSQLVDSAINASVQSSDALLAPLRDMPSAMELLVELLRLYENRLDDLLK